MIIRELILIVDGGCSGEMKPFFIQFTRQKSNFKLNHSFILLCISKLLHLTGFYLRALLLLIN